MIPLIAHLNTRELEALLKDFYLLTGIKIVVFDTDYKEVISYPDSHCAYCQTLRDHPDCLKKCMENNLKSFQYCKRTSEILVYHCHAGLIETCAPLMDNGIPVGYLMFGQITDTGNDKELLDLVEKTFRENNIVPAVPAAELLAIERKTTRQIYATAKILEACTFYVLLKHLMSAKRQNFVENLNAYLEEHLWEELTAEQIAGDFSISRSKLYSACEKYLGVGIAQYIKTRRLEKAKELLEHTTLTISDIAARTGFADYNYFCRVFKKEVGVPAKKYRALFQ